MHGGGDDDAFGYSAPDLAPRDYQKALHWYQLAAKQGHGQAVGELGWAHAKGKGTPKDFIKAYAWATVAAVQGDTRAPSLKTGSERKCLLRSSPRPARPPPRFGPGLSASTSDKVPICKPGKLGAPKGILDCENRQPARQSSRILGVSDGKVLVQTANGDRR